MQPVMCEGKRKERGYTVSHAYQITHFPPVFIMAFKQTHHTQSGLCVCLYLCSHMSQEGCRALEFLVWYFLILQKHTVCACARACAYCMWRLDVFQN